MKYGIFLNEINKQDFPGRQSSSEAGQPDWAQQLIQLRGYPVMFYRQDDVSWLW